jgi:hypothetical protein
VDGGGVRRMGRGEGLLFHFAASFETSAATIAGSTREPSTRRRVQLLQGRITQGLVTVAFSDGRSRFDRVHR